MKNDNQVYVKNQEKWMPAIGTALAVCALLLTLSGCAPAFRGSSVKSADTYALEIQAMTGTDRHTMELRKADALKIRFETVKGSLCLEITAPDGAVVYRGNGKETAEFTLNIQSDGVYVICVEARRAQGTIHIAVQEGAASGPVTAPGVSASPLNAVHLLGAIANGNETGQTNSLFSIVRSRRFSHACADSAYPAAPAAWV